MIRLNEMFYYEHKMIKQNILLMKGHYFLHQGK